MALALPQPFRVADHPTVILGWFHEVGDASSLETLSESTAPPLAMAVICNSCHPVSETSFSTPLKELQQ